MKKGLGFLAAVVAMIASEPLQNGSPLKSKKSKEAQKPQKPKEYIPDGCEKYYFDKYGNCIDGPETAVYECIARNYKNAQRKYQNWREKHG